MTCPKCGKELSSGGYYEDTDGWPLHTPDRCIAALVRKLDIATDSLRRIAKYGDDRKSRSCASAALAALAKEGTQ